VPLPSSGTVSVIRWLSVLDPSRHDTSADASGDLLINGKQLQRVSALPQRHAALMVVRTSSHQILNNHNGFFKSEFVDFLVRYVMDIEAMRFEARLAR
jgi:hypothetical protein